MSKRPQAKGQNFYLLFIYMFVIINIISFVKNDNNPNNFPGGNQC